MAKSSRKSYYYLGMVHAFLVSGAISISFSLMARSQERFDGETLLLVTGVGLLLTALLAGWMRSHRHASAAKPTKP